MLKGLFHITFVSEIIALMAACILLRGPVGRWRYFILFLAATVAVEFTGWLMVWKLGYKNNSWIYNLRLCVDICFLLWILIAADVMHRVRSAFPYICFSVIILTSVTVVFYAGLTSYNSNVEIFNDIVLAITSCYLLFQLLKEEQYREISRYEYFWLANGILVFCLVSAVLAVGRNQLFIFQGATGQQLSQQINDFINVLYYGSLIIAFVCRYRNTQRLS